MSFEKICRVAAYLNIFIQWTFSAASRIADALERLQTDLTGDVKKLTNFTPEYRLRVGQFRVLFEIENETRIIVYRVVHRREAYR